MATLWSQPCNNRLIKLYFVNYLFDNFQAIICTFEDLSQRDYSDYDMAVFVIMAHGKKDKIIGSDSKDVDIQNDLICKICKCESLKDKPKIFLFQACRIEGI